MDEPGSFSGKINSPRPHRGPEPNQRRSFAIFIKAQANVFMVLCAITRDSWAARAANLLGAETNGNCVIAAICLAARSANCGCVFKPVPTAVPPKANS